MNRQPWRPAFRKPRPAKRKKTSWPEWAVAFFSLTLLAVGISTITALFLAWSFRTDIRMILWLHDHPGDVCTEAGTEGGADFVCYVPAGADPPFLEAKSSPGEDVLAP